MKILHVFVLFFSPTDRPTHLHEREGDGKRNILLGWPNGTKKKSPRHRELVSSLYSSDDPTEASKLLRSSTNLLYSWQYFTLAHSTNCQGYSICYSLSVTYMLDLGKYSCFSLLTYKRDVLCTKKNYFFLRKIDVFRVLSASEGRAAKYESLVRWSFRS